MSVLTTESLPGTDLARSREYCEFVTHTQARNFYYGLKLLPEPKRSAMFTLYAYMRLADDIADEEDGRTLNQRIDELEAWREQTNSIFTGGANDQTDPPALGRIADSGRDLWPAFAEMVRQYNIPRHLFDDVIAGQRQDLEPEPFETFDQLHTYCYRVAGVVGLASIYIWGFVGGPETEALAVDRGVAFQLTNILRDLREDAARGRLYLPLEDLTAMNVTETDLRGARGGSDFTRLMRFQIDRAESYYRKSADLEQRIQRDSRQTLVAMTQIYHRLLQKIAVRPERVLRERVSLSVISKLMIGWRAARSR